MGYRGNFYMPSTLSTLPLIRRQLESRHKPTQPFLNGLVLKIRLLRQLFQPGSPVTQYSTHCAEVIDWSDMLSLKQLLYCSFLDRNDQRRSARLPL